MTATLAPVMRPAPINMEASDKFIVEGTSFLYALSLQFYFLQKFDIRSVLIICPHEVF
jgi:hypothetical protein